MQTFTVDKEFEQTCLRLQFDKTCHLTPLESLYHSIKGVKAKKVHELSYLVPFLRSIALKEQTCKYVDVGAGKCYCPIAFLDHHYSDLQDARKVSFLAIEEGLSLCGGEWKPETIRDKHPNLDIYTGKFTKEVLQEIKDQMTVLYSLHACGSLSTTMIDAFVASPRVRVMINIGCCYQLGVSRDSNDIVSGGLLYHQDETPWKHLLSTIDPWSLFNLANLENISEKGMKSLVDTAMRPLYENDSDGNNNDNSSKHADLLLEKHICQLTLLWKYRTMLAPVVESIILYDRLLHLKEKGLKFNLLAAWPVQLSLKGADLKMISPRNLAIIVEREPSIEETTT
jgi:hypothetical protein